MVWNCNDLVGWEKAGHRARLPRFVHQACSRTVIEAERKIVRDIDTVVVLSNQVKAAIESAYGRPAYIVHAGVDADRLREQPDGGAEIRARYGIQSGMFLAMWMGILEPFRRLEDLLEAIHILIQRNISTHCLIVGRTQDARVYVNSLKRLVSAHGLQSHVKFVEDTIPEERLADYYSACDVFVFPNDQQSWGLAPLEALSCRRPVIVSRGSGVHEVLRDGDTAVLVPPRNPEALANAISRIANDPVLAQKIAHHGREFVAGELTWDSFTNSMADLMERAVFKHSPRRTNTWSARRPAAGLVQGVVSATEPLWRIR